MIIYLIFQSFYTIFIIKFKINFQPIYSKASCCPIKYDCSNNSTAVISNIRQGSDNKIANVHRRNRSNGMLEF